MLPRQQNNTLENTVLKPLVVMAKNHRTPKLLFLSACVRTALVWTWQNQLRVWFMPELAQPKSLGTSSPVSAQRQSLAAWLTQLVPGEGTVSVFTRLWPHLCSESPDHPAPLALLQPALRSGRGAHRLGVLSGGSKPGVHGRSTPRAPQC